MDCAFLSAAKKTKNTVLNVKTKVLRGPLLAFHDHSGYCVVFVPLRKWQQSQQKHGSAILVYKIEINKKPVATHIKMSLIPNTRQKKEKRMWYCVNKSKNTLHILAFSGVFWLFCQKMTKSFRIVGKQRSTAATRKMGKGKWCSIWIVRVATWHSKTKAKREIPQIQIGALAFR